MSVMKRLRQMKGMSQDEVSVLADVPQPVLSKIERGLVKPTPSIQEAQKRIADILGVPTQQLFPGEQP